MKVFAAFFSDFGIMFFKNVTATSYFDVLIYEKRCYNFREIH